MTTEAQMHCTVINKQLAYWRGGIIANPFEATKALCLANAEGKLSKFLPYAIKTVELPDDDPDLCPQGYALGRWRLWLGDDKFRRDPKLFKELLEGLDFSKPFDQSAAERIDAQFSVTTSKQVEIDAVEIEEARHE